MFLAAVILAIMFFALVCHDQPARPPVIERRAKQKQLTYD